MSTNFVKSGEILDLAAPYAVAAGAGALVGSVFGVSLNTLANGVTGPFAIKGVFDLLLHSGDTPAPGALVYWDNTNKYVTTTSTSNTKIGVAENAVASGTVVRVRLNGAF